MILARVREVSSASAVAVVLAACGSGEPTSPEARLAPEVSTVEVSPDPLSFAALQETAQLTATARDASGALISDARFTWMSSAPDFASVTSDGLVTAVANGPATITATADGVSGTTSVTVSQEAASVSVTPSADTLFTVGDTLRLTAEALDANSHPISDPSLEWISSDESVATVDDEGLVTAVDLGTALVTATISDHTAETEVTVDDGELNYDIGPGVPASDVAVIQEGMDIARAFLDEYVGGDIPPEVRTNITAKIVATGEGNQEEGGGGACCTGLAIGPNRESIIRPFFDVAHGDWINRPTFVSWSVADDRRVIAAHEYTHGWQHLLGCISVFEQPLGNWMNEGIAHWLGHRPFILAGRMNEQDVLEFMVFSARDTGQLEVPLVEFEATTSQPWSGHVGYVAIDMLVGGSPSGVMALRTICEEVADGRSVDEAFEAAFGVSKAAFYAQFEEWRLENQ